MSPRARRSDIYVANESFACEYKGESYVAVKGVTRVREGHALLKAAPNYFDPIEEHVHYDVEQATAAPGERRGA